MNRTQRRAMQRCHNRRRGLPRPAGGAGGGEAAMWRRAVQLGRTLLAARGPGLYLAAEARHEPGCRRPTGAAPCTCPRGPELVIVWTPGTLN